MDMTGSVLGTHQGIPFYTPGQRKGLGIATGDRLYVQRVLPDTNTVVLGPEQSLLSSSCTVADLNILDPRIARESIQTDCKVRYATPPSKATITPQQGNTAAVSFEHPQRALSPGQSAVFYEGEIVLGGGIIQSC